MKLFAFEKSSKTGLFPDSDPQTAMQLHHNPDAVLWIDAHPAATRWLRSVFKLNKHWLDIGTDPARGTYIEQAGSMLFMKIPVYNPNRIGTAGETGAVSLFIHADYLISIHDKPVDAFDKLHNQDDLLSRCCARGTGYLTTYLIECIVSENRAFAERLKLQVDMFLDTIQAGAPARLSPVWDQLQRIHHHTVILASFEKEMQKLTAHPPQGLKNRSARRVLRRIVYNARTVVHELSQIEHSATAIQANALRTERIAYLKILNRLVFVFTVPVLTSLPIITIFLAAISPLPVWIDLILCGSGIAVCLAAAGAVVRILRQTPPDYFP